MEAEDREESPKPTSKIKDRRPIHTNQRTERQFFFTTRSSEKMLIEILGSFICCQQTQLCQQRKASKGQAQAERKETQHRSSPPTINRSKFIQKSIFLDHSISFNNLFQSTGGSTGEDEGELSPSWDETKKNTIMNEGSTGDGSKTELKGASPRRYIG